ncbi:TIGR03086 family metal-binding protein [Nocardioides plantarum]|uniref:TIGR03086 family metal-binding protein n=1 Tax=Nocardioides plantarum TaxID=29299 RepID=A0ABV5KCC5_9ACTN|nr:TIGR03086 family metal-binding protein [Nocardioides plantarum]
MTTNQAVQADPRPLLLAAAAQVTTYVDRVRLDDLDRPTPCAGWTVRDLLSHLVAVSVRVPHVLRGGHPFEVPSQVEGVADRDWAGAWAERQPELVAALGEDAVLERTVHHPAGDMPAAAAIVTYVSELVTHGWDLAAALGDTSGLDDALAATCLAPLQGALPAGIRDEDRVPFGAVVPVPDDAPALDRLLGWVGRDPRWTP